MHDCKPSIIIYEPDIKATEFEGFVVEDNFKKFIKLSDVIVTNRWDSELESAGVSSKQVYTRDLFGEN